MNVKQNSHIEIVISELAGLNIMSADSSKKICEVLKKYFTRVEITVIREKADLKKLVEKRPDLIFSGDKYVGFVEGTLDRESPDKLWLSAFFESKGINYTGSDVHALELEFDKVLAKEKMIKNGVNTAPFFTTTPGQFNKNDPLPLPFPLFIKPIYEGDGKGVGSNSIVNNFEEFEKKVESIFQEFGQSSLVERYLSGREFTVGIFDDKTIGQQMAMPAEITIDADSHEGKVLSHEAKNSDRVHLVTVVDPKEHQALSEFALKAFTALGARDYGRIDIRMDAEGNLTFLEANLLPGLSPNGSYFTLACKLNTSMNYEDILLRIVESRLKRADRAIPSHT